MLIGLVRALCCAGVLAGALPGVVAPHGRIDAVSPPGAADPALAPAAPIRYEPPDDARERIDEPLFQDSAATPPAIVRTSVRNLRVTAYSDRGLTAAGVPSGIGQCAAPGDVPFGSIVYVPALHRAFVVTDRTARRFRGNTIDIFMPSRDQCLLFGRRYLDVLIYLPDRPHRYGAATILNKALSVQRGDLALALADHWHD